MKDEVHFKQFYYSHVVLWYQSRPIDISFLVYKQFTALLVYINDFILAGTDMTKINSVKSKLNDTFNTKNLGALRYFLGIEVSRSST